MCNLGCRLYSKWSGEKIPQQPGMHLKVLPLAALKLATALVSHKVHRQNTQAEKAPSTRAIWHIYHMVTWPYEAERLWKVMGLDMAESLTFINWSSIYNLWKRLRDLTAIYQAWNTCMDGHVPRDKIKWQFFLFGIAGIVHFLIHIPGWPPKEWCTNN